MRNLALALVFVCFAKLPAAELTGEAILHMALEGEGRQEKLRQQYVWHEHVEVGPAKVDGSSVKVNITRDFEITFLKGSFYRELTRCREREAGEAYAPHWRSAWGHSFSNGSGACPRRGNRESQILGRTI